MVALLSQDKITHRMKIAIPEFFPLINGKKFIPKPERIRFMTNPWTQSRSAKIHENIPNDVKLAVQSAVDAINGPWGSWTASDRRNLLFKLAQTLSVNKAHLARLEAQSGKPITQALEDIDACVDTFNYFASYIPKGSIWNDVTSVSYTIPEPIGVTALITSFNYPALLAVWKIAPCLAAGNTLIIKPSIQTPQSTCEMMNLFKDLCPPGVINCVLGGADIGMELVENENVACISFTGSTLVGRDIGAKCGTKRTILELGGKNCAIVCADVDIESTAIQIVNGAFSNMGQNCCGISKVYIHSSIHDAMLKRIVYHSRNLMIGDPSLSSTQFSALIDSNHFNNITTSIAIERETNPPLIGGNSIGSCTIPPTIFNHVADDSKLATMEIFGPVLAIMEPFDEIETAVSRANKTNYGLACGLWTNDIRTKEYVVKKMRVGMVWINKYNILPPFLPFGGRGHSGQGKELGEEGLAGYTFTKSVYSKL